jgi:hypothetical protein
MVSKANQPGAKVDYLVDENGQPLDVPDNSTVRGARDNEESVGSTGPTNWWMYGLAALAVLAFIVLVMQLASGTPGTDVQPGTPVAAPETTAPAAY